MTNMQNKCIDINYAIVETVRPTLYRCMKYWGKKPHNVWYEYINHYVPNNGVFLDPFCGSGMSGIEAIRTGCKAVCLDINPLTSFIFDVMCSDFNEKEFDNTARRIVSEVMNDLTYRNLYCYKSSYILHNSKYKHGQCYECCFINEMTGEKCAEVPDQVDLKAINDSKRITIPFEYPNIEFRDSEAYSSCLKNKIGTNFANLYTNRNLYVLSLIFDKILKLNDEHIKMQCLFAFIQTVHLSTRMCIPRSKKTNRDFSTSWGRSGYFVANSEMEMNPLLLFQNNCFGKQSVTSCLNSLAKYVGKIKGKKIGENTKLDFSEDYNLWYGVVDSKNLSSIIPQESIDFVLTDPPYGGLIQYLDLSTIWLSWLSIYKPNEYYPNYEQEITINRHSTSLKFQNDMTSVLKEVGKVLKPSSKMVLTFNNKKMDVWNALLSAIQYSGFEIEKVVHQQNKRSGESNVCDIYGTSSTDFYIRCKKSQSLPHVLSNAQIENLIVKTATKLIAKRFEPTPYQILLNGIIAQISEDCIVFDNVDFQIKKVLEKHIGTIFSIENNIDSLAGNYWWLIGYNYQPNDSNTLSNRVKSEIEKLKSKGIVSENEILTTIYHEFPNGMSPDIVMVRNYIKKPKEAK